MKGFYRSQQGRNTKEKSKAHAVFLKDAGVPNSSAERRAAAFL